MIQLTVRAWGETKVTEHEDWPTAHHALVASTDIYKKTFDLDPVKGTISGSISNVGRFYLKEVEA
ncbi:hypothetical protein SEA_STEPHIG9_99 [Mycobacterium phage Stephig9]|uniref:Uncharacterized protein n=1 Tax=Mycobacterium phage Stephig9 TaxID=2591224 RepID=A0A514DHH3_9CAUD|nr:hypothetical protein SEA_STEPHIG9_99 [Mycobacterium phage Stephig9]